MSWQKVGVLTRSSVASFLLGLLVAAEVRPKQIAAIRSLSFDAEYCALQVRVWRRRTGQLIAVRKHGLIIRWHLRNRTL